MQIEKIIVMVTCILFVVISAVNFLSMYKIKKRYKLFKMGTDEENLEILLERYINLVNEIKNKNINMEDRITNIENNILNNIQKVGLKRYNAFSDMSNNLSFSLALLDANNTGIIITELYLRNSATIYVREIKDGFCEIRLSDEEQEAIKKAQKIYDKKIRGDATKCWT